IGRALQEMNRAERGSEPSPDLLSESAAQLSHAFDTRNGGFGSQPKFPNTMSLEIFLRQWKNSGDESYLKMVNLALRKMAEGGIYDQLGGGFHRYATDAIWLVPHFEKMLYDNALLTRSYTQAYQATGDPFFEKIAHEVLHYVSREMTSPEGGFYSTQDADSEGEEGKFFVWTPTEVHQILGEADGALLSQFYDVTTNGNFEHRQSILHAAGSLERLAKDYGMSVEQVESTLARGRERLFQERESRIKPFRDEKILTGWNGLMISAFAEAGKVFGKPEYIEAAARAAKFIQDQLFDGNRLKRNFCQGQARGEGYLDDYAFLIAGLLDLYEASYNLEWLQWAASLLDTMITLFRDDPSADFFFTPAGAESLIVRPRQNHDQAIPSGVSVAAMDLLRLSGLLDRTELREHARGIFQANSEEMERNPHGTGSLICAWDMYQHGPAEVVILADRDREAVQQALAKMHRQYAPNKIVVVALPGSQEPPIVRGKEPRGGEMTGYVCRNFTCSAPVTSWDALTKELEAGN
ncbi:MAG: thioredoxin domain-containing protein, partial [Armatimonadota bacterium]|nr:thioredoxin domain-containing protein [Armatimonadota bacterium]